MKLPSCAVTGHRPTRFKFKYKEDTAGCKRLKKRLHDQFALLYQNGVRCFFVGGALGVDMWAAEILLRMKEQPEYEEVELITVLPFEGYDAKWDERSRSRMQFIRRHSRVVVVDSVQGSESYLKRNRYMVDHADYLIAVFDNEHSIRSGTQMTVNYARKRKLPIILIHPDSGKVTEEYG